MQTPSDVQNVIDKLEQRITSMQQTIEMLRKEFGIASHGNSPRKKKSKRKDQLIKFLTKNGPSSRKEIEENTHIPTGTIASLLNDKETFNRLESGKWEVKGEQ